MSRNHHSDITKDNKKIARQLIFYIVIFSSLITLLITALQLYQDYSREVEQIENQIEQIKKSSLQSLTMSLWDIYDSQLQLQLEGILQLPDIEYLEISSKGRVYVSVGKLQSENTISATFPMVHIFDKKEIIIGELQIIATVDKVYQRLYNKILFILFFNGIKTFIVSVFMFFIFHSFVIRHLERISKHTKSTPYDFNSVLTIDRRDINDELQQVVDAINNMRKNLLESFTELKVNERRFRAMFEQAAIGVAQVETKTGRFVKINQKYCDIVGYSAKEMETMKFQDITHPDDLQTDLNNMNKFAKGMISGFSVEKRYLGKDGSIVWGNLTVSPLLENGERQGYNLAIVEDITGRKQAEAEKENLERRLRQAHKMEAIGTLAGGIAHDFNNILAAIQGYAEFIQEEVPKDSKIGENIAEILAAESRAADLVRQILTISRKRTLEKQILEPHLVVKEALKMLRATIPTTVTIEENIDLNCGKIVADPTTIHQIVVNLCTNGLHAMVEQKGTLYVDLQCRELSAAEINQGANVSAGLFVVLIVRDTGSGMNQSTIGRIFEPYFTTKEIGRGTGLGLAIIHSAVEDSKGFIEVKSQVGKGTTFSVYFPVTEEPAYTIRAASIEKKGKKEVISGDARILIVDDEPLLTKINATRLTKRGYQVTAVTDSNEALNMFRRQPENFDLLVTDQTMPGLTGVELAKEMLEIKPSLPIIMCTGHSEVVSKEKAIALGIKKFVFKPLHGDELLDTVQEVLSEK